VSEPQLKRRISVPKDLSPRAQKALGEKLIAYIKERTDNGIDKDGSRFSKYSESYVKSQAFKNAGKSKNDVNLRLSEEMMNSLQVLSSGSGYIELGYEPNSSANDKARWSEASDNGPSRKFLGVKDSELQKLVAATVLENSSLSTEEEDALAAAITSSILGED